MKIPFLILLFALCSISPSCALQDLLTKVAKLYEIPKKLINIPTNASTTKLMVAELTNQRSQVGKLIRQIMAAIDDIDNEKEIGDIFSIIGEFIEIFPKLVSAWASSIQTQIRDINFEFADFRIFYKKSVRVKGWKDFAEKNANLATKMSKIQSMLFASPKNMRLHPGILSLLVNESIITNSTYCARTSLIQYFLGQFFQALILTETQALTMSIYSYMVQYADQEGWREVLPLRLNSFKNRLMFYVNQFSNIMGIARKDLTACDPPNGARIRDKTYFEMERIEQRVIFTYTRWSWWKNCDQAISENLMTYKFEQDSCSGDLLDCVNSGNLDVCRLENGAKRYEWITATAGAAYGMNIDKCPNGTISAYHDWRTRFCICKCREYGHNRVSLNLVKTDVRENMVITGLRFIREKEVLYIQVKQGKLLANGWIDYDSENWIPHPENLESAVITSTNNKFYLDDIILPENYLAVGVRFRDDDGFSIEVTAQKFNFSTGILSSATFEKSVDHADYKQLSVPQQNSIYTNLTHTPDSNKNWIKLQSSSLHHDAGQSVLPLFDGVSVESYSPVGGIGIVHKGVKDYAGFISPRLFALQHRQHLLNFIQNNPLGGELART